MTEQELQKQRDHEEDLQRLRGFRPIDDTFMRILFRDNLPLAEYVLRIITNKPDLHLTKEETQKDLVRLVGARGLCLDVHGIDDENQHYDIEVQRADAGARPERARYTEKNARQPVGSPDLIFLGRMVLAAALLLVATLVKMPLAVKIILLVLSVAASGYDLASEIEEKELEQDLFK